jgi:hypothetical protein
MYVFDNSPLSTLFKNYYPRRFPTLWRHFNELVAAGNLVSTREALREIEDGPLGPLRTWADNHHSLFPAPGAERQHSLRRSMRLNTFSRTSNNKSC